jgi:hypothetical protein
VMTETPSACANLNCTVFKSAISDVLPGVPKCVNI